MKKLLLLPILLSMFLWGYFNMKERNRQLIEHGIHATAVIYDVKVRKGRYTFDYSFVVNDRVYNGWSSSAKVFRKGDTIDILYLPSDFSKNKPSFNVVP